MDGLLRWPTLGGGCWGLMGPQHSEAHPVIWASGECAQEAHSPGRMTSPSPDSQVPDSRTAQNLVPSQKGRWVLSGQHAFLGHSHRMVPSGAPNLHCAHVQVLQTLQSTPLQPQTDSVSQRLPPKPAILSSRSWEGCL